METRLENIGSFIIPKMDRKLLITDSTLNPFLFESYIFNDMVPGEYIITREYDEGNLSLVNLYLTHKELLKLKSFDIAKEANIIVWENLEILNGECIITRLSKWSSLPVNYEIPVNNVYIHDNFIALSVLEGQTLIRANSIDFPTHIRLDFPTLD